MKHLNFERFGPFLPNELKSQKSFPTYFSHPIPLAFPHKSKIVLFLATSNYDQNFHHKMKKSRVGTERSERPIDLPFSSFTSSLLISEDWSSAKVHFLALITNKHRFTNNRMDWKSCLIFKINRSIITLFWPPVITIKFFITK